MRYLKTGLKVLFIICIVSFTSKRREMVLPELPLYSLDKGIYEDHDAFKGRKKYIASLSGRVLSIIDDIITAKKKRIFQT